MLTGAELVVLMALCALAIAAALSSKREAEVGEPMAAAASLALSALLAILVFALLFHTVAARL